MSRASTIGLPAVEIAVSDHALLRFLEASRRVRPGAAARRDRGLARPRPRDRAGGRGEEVLDRRRRARLHGCQRRRRDRRPRRPAAREGGQVTPPAVGNRQSAAAVIERLREAAGCVNDAALAKRFKIAPSSISKWRARDSVPVSVTLLVSEATGVDLQYLRGLSTGGGDSAPKFSALGEALEQVQKAEEALARARQVLVGEFERALRRLA